MRYQLSCADCTGDVTLSPAFTEDGKQILKAAFNDDEEKWEKEIHLGPDLIQVKESDGSLRRIAYTPDSPDPAQINFFHQGRPRSVQSVGGVGGRVEGLQSEGTVCAPMNGQVVKVPAKVGDVVESGEIVLILEAMKMENEVAAPIAGTIADISVAPGENVNPGQILFTVESGE